MNGMINVLSSFLTKTAWMMEKPKAYGLFHLCFMLIGFFLCGFLAWKLRNLGEKGTRRVLLTVGVFLAVSEIYKQLFYTYVIGGGHYQWWIFPFQLCSVPMYFCLILPFIKQGKISRAMYTFLMTYNFLGGMISFFEPSGLFHEYWTLTLHALIWHMMLVFLGLFVFFSGKAGLNKEDYKDATLTFLSLCVLAFCINCIFWKPSAGSIKMFYVGPATSPLAIFKNIAESFGWYVCTMVYVPVLCLGAFAIFSVFRLIHSKIEKRSSAAVGEKEKSLV